MDIHTIVSTFQSVLHQHTGMGYFVDLLLKSCFVLVLLVCINLFTARLAASLRHLVWCIGFIALFFLPLFIGFIPKIQVPITTVEIMETETSGANGIVDLAGNINLVLGAWWKSLVALYLSLLLVQLLYAALGLCKVFFLSRSAKVVESPVIHYELENLVLEEGLTVSVGLLKSREVFSPVSWGLFRPEIILPEQAEGWDKEKIRNVLIHELSHIQRLDWLTSLIVRITRAIYWYNPLIWYAARKLNEEAEQACDDAVILNGRCHNQYASNLLEIASHARLGNIGNMIVQAIAGSFLGSRVFSILDTGRKRQKTEFVWVVRAILVACTVIAILASLRFVPIVNVSSIDPNASTAFSVIFIPEDEGSIFGGYVEYIYQDDDDLLQQPDQRTLPAAGTKEAPGAVRQAQARSPRSKENKKVENPGPVGDEGEVQSKRPSLLEEYISSTGMKNSKDIFESYVDEYTSSLIEKVESGIRLPELEVLREEDESVPEKRTVVAIRKKEPVYPFLARKRGIEGYSTIEYEIDTSGNVVNPVVVDSRPRGIFNRSALEAIQHYSFKPPEINGEVVSIKGLQTKFIYQLKPG